jgi:hypothetical protein
VITVWVWEMVPTIMPAGILSMLHARSDFPATKVPTGGCPLALGAGGACKALPPQLQCPPPPPRPPANPLLTWTMEDHSGCPVDQSMPASTICSVSTSLATNPCAATSNNDSNTDDTTTTSSSGHAGAYIILCSMSGIDPCNNSCRAET